MFFLTFDEEQNHARSKVPKFDYFDSKMFNFSSLFLIKFVRQNKGRYFDMTRNENVFSSGPCASLKQGTIKRGYENEL